MKTEINSIVIAGAGQAAAAAAVELRRAGYAGRITLVGDEQHLPYERPQLSKEMLRLDVQPLQLSQSAEALAEPGIELLLGCPIVSVDAAARVVSLEDGRHLDYDRLLIATGVRPRQLSCAHDDRVTYLRTVEHAEKLRDALLGKLSLVIVGGGVIGLEVASAAIDHGCQVTLVEAAPRLMPRSLDADVAARLGDLHRQRGVTIIHGATVENIAADGTVTLSDDTRIKADSILAGIGVQPNIEAFADLGICDDAGIRVDEFGRTAIPEIYATGDVASQPCGDRHGRIETWANAQEHAACVARNIVGEPSSCERPIWFWSDQGTLNLQVIGDALAGHAVLRGEPESGRFSQFRIGEDDRLLGCVSWNSPKDMAMARRWVRDGALVDSERLADLAADLRMCVR